jgi:hypothetical protein
MSPYETNRVPLNNWNQFRSQVFAVEIFLVQHICCAGHKVPQSICLMRLTKAFNNNSNSVGISANMRKLCYFHNDAAYAHETYRQKPLWRMRNTARENEHMPLRNVNGFVLAMLQYHNVHCTINLIKYFLNKKRHEERELTM